MNDTTHDDGLLEFARETHPRTVELCEKLYDVVEGEFYGTAAFALAWVLGRTLAQCEDEGARRAMTKTSITLVCRQAGVGSPFAAPQREGEA